MKSLFPLLIFLFFFSCANPTTGSNNTAETDSISGRKLVEQGFLDLAEPQNIDELKSAVIDSFYIYASENGNFVPIDAEELAEGSFNFFLPQLNAVLKKRAVELRVEQTETHSLDMIIVLNGEKLTLYTDNEMKKGNFWDTASRNFFKKVNSLLAQKSVKERFYLLYEGNGLAAILLTDKQFEIIEKHYQREPKEIPYSP